MEVQEYKHKNMIGELIVVHLFNVTENNKQC